MCGICACIGFDDAIERVVDGLRKLEYRGYDSSGLAFFVDKKIRTIKSVGKIESLRHKLTKEDFSNIVIGHTRWATHGKVSEENSHPHVSADGKFAMVHNGIIENFEELKVKYLSGIKLNSETDTEIFVNLISCFKGGILEKLQLAMQEIEGSFAVAILEEGTQKIYFAKRGSPLMISQNEKGCMAGSDISVFDEDFKNCYILDDDQIACVSQKNIYFFKNGQKIQKNQEKIDFYANFNEFFDEKNIMEKEIQEQPIVLKRTYFKYFSENILNEKIIKEINKFKSFHFIACGSAYHSALIGAKYLQKFCNKKAQASVASEFRYDKNIFKKDCLYIFVSQSGETADTIACAKLAKENSMKTLAVTNVPYCTLNKIADFVVPTFAGREVAVASTKTFTAQILTLFIFALLLSNRMKLKMQLKRFVSFFEVKKFDQNILKKVCGFEKIFFIGRGLDYVTSLEASLKLKEIAYINCLGIAAGELKHGTLALVDEKTLVIAISTQEHLKEKMESNIQEVKARGGKILLLSNLNHKINVDMSVQLPQFACELMPIVSIVPLQQLAQEYALYLGYDPDKPRNLAKSVTVE